MTFLRRPVFLVCYVAVVLMLSSFYFLHYPIPGFFERAGELARALFFLIFLAATGRSILRREIFSRLWGPGEGCGMTPFLLSVGVGGVPVVLALLGMGVLGFFRPGPILIVTFLWSLWVWRDGLFWVLGLLGGCLDDRRLGPTGGSAALAVGITGLAVLCAFAPPTYYDSLVYHLALPAQYLQEGRVGFVPYNQYAHFPQNMEMIFAWFLAAGSDVSAQLFNVLLAVLTGAGLWSLLRPTSKDFGFRWDFLLYLTAPCVLLLSTETYVETPLAFWTLLAVWCAAQGARDGKRGWFVLSGLLGGFAAGLKYTGVLTPALLSVLLVVWPRPRKLRDRWKDAFCVAGVSFLVFCPWLVKNYFYTGGNPVFPFLPSVFPAKNVYMFKESAQAYFQVLDEYRGTSALLLELFKMPFRLASEATTFGGGFDVTGDLGWALPLFLLPLCGLVASPTPSAGFLTAYVGAHLLAWASLRPVLRFLFPVFPLVCALGGQALGQITNGRHFWVRRSVGAAVGLFVLSNAVLFYWVERVRDPLPVAAGLQSRDQYLTRKLDYYPWMKAMENLPPESRVLFVGDQRSYYCPRPHLAPMALLPTPLKEWADTAADPNALRQRLLAEGFTHLFFHRKEAERLRSYRVLDLTPQGRMVFDGLIKQLPVLGETPEAGLFALEVP